MAWDLEFNGVAFLDHFSQRKDPRIERKNVLPLNEIFLPTLTPTICGGESYRDVKTFGYEKLDFLGSSCPSLIPFHSMIHVQEYFHLLIQKILGDCLIQLVKSIPEVVTALISMTTKHYAKDLIKQILNQLFTSL